MSNEINPDSVILQQARETDDFWQKNLALILFKLAPDGIEITSDDMMKFMHQDKNVILTHGHPESIEFKLVTMESAKRLAAHDANQRSKNKH